MGLIWAATTRLSEITVRYERYVRGLRALGHDALTVCLPAAAAGYSEPVTLAPSEAALRDPEFYRPQRFEAALVITWLRLPDVVAAVKKNCPWVVSIADSDGLIGVRVHPRATFRRMTLQHTGAMDRVRAAGYWGRLYLFAPSRLDRPVLESGTHTDRIAAGAPRIADHLRLFFAYYHRPDLAAKLVVAPYPVDPPYLAGWDLADRADQVVAIGRWDDPQKDAGLLSRTIERYLTTGGTTAFALIGRGGEPWFGKLTRRWPEKVHVLGLQPPEVVAATLSRSRSLIIPSRWEGAPVVLNEALASGCTVVGTDAVPSVESACGEDGFGTVCRGRSAAGLAQALRSEMDAWDRGERDPVAVAAHWRRRFDPVTVCRQLLAGHPAEVTPRVADA